MAVGNSKDWGKKEEEVGILNELQSSNFNMPNNPEFSLHYRLSVLLGLASFSSDSMMIRVSVSLTSSRDHDDGPRCKLVTILVLKVLQFSKVTTV